MAQHPERMVHCGHWRKEPYSYVTVNAGHSRVKLSTMYRSVDRGDVVCFATDEEVYRLSDCVYVDSQRLECSYYIGQIQAFNMTKRDQLNVVLKWYYRFTELPELVHLSLIQDRRSEFAVLNSSAEVRAGRSPGCLPSLPSVAAGSLESRELFVTDAVDSYSVSALRGKCIVRHYKDLNAARREFVVSRDTFFYILQYLPEQSRMTAIIGEIRVGPSHQARLPELRVDFAFEDDRKVESPVWFPDQIDETDLKVYLNAVRSSVINRALMLVGSVENVEDAADTAMQDTTLDAALRKLHECDYNAIKATDQLVQGPLPLTIDAKWTEDETKKFIKGIRQHGKNFFKIRKELLPHKETAHLIEFYYLWKKTAGASAARPRSRQRRPQSMLRRIKPGTKPSRPPSNEFEDHSSASEQECDSDDSDAKDMSQYACHHCFSTASKDWHHAGKDRALLCTDCRLHFKKYGDLPTVDAQREAPQFMFKPVSRDDDTSQTGSIRTRRSKETPSKKRRRSHSPSSEAEKARKSPSSASTSSTSSLEKQDETDIVNAGLGKSRRRAQAVDNVLPPTGGKKRRHGRHSPSGTSSLSGAVSTPLRDGRVTATSPSASVIQAAIARGTTNSSGGMVSEGVGTTDDREDTTYEIGAAFGKPQSLVVRTEVKTEPCDPLSDEEENRNTHAHDKDPTKDPPAKIDGDTEVYTSEHAIFRRHWFRPEKNSCSRTDLVFMPKPESALAKRRDHLRQQVDREIKVEPRHDMGNVTSTVCRPATSVTHRTPFSTGSGVPTFAAPSFNSQAAAAAAAAAASCGGPEHLPALQRLRDIANASTLAASGGVLFQPNMPMLDPIMRDQVLSGMYGPAERERLERELQERRDGFELMSKSGLFPPNVDPRQWIELQHRLGGAPPGSVPQMMSRTAFPAVSAASSLFGATADPNVYERVQMERLAAERAQLEQLLVSGAAVNPLLKMQIEQRLAALAAAFPQHHTHTHSHTHLHIHPSQESTVGLGAVPPAGTLPPLWPPVDALYPGFAPGRPPFGMAGGMQMMDPASTLLLEQQLRNAGMFPGVFSPFAQAGMDPLLQDRLQQLQREHVERQLHEQQQQHREREMAVHDMMRRRQEECSSALPPSSVIHRGDKR